MPCTTRIFNVKYFEWLLDLNEEIRYLQKYFQICFSLQIDRPRISYLKLTCKVLSLLEACFDLIWGSSLHMKIQIMGGKITENLGFKSLLRKVIFFVLFFLFIFKFSIKNCISLYLTTFEYLVLRIRYQ